MKYIKWIEVTLKLEICFIIQKVVIKCEQLWTVNKFNSTKRDESKQKKGLWAKHPRMPRGEPFEWGYYLDSSTRPTLESEWRWYYCYILKGSGGKFQDKGALGWDAGKWKQNCLELSSDHSAVIFTINND